MQQRNKSGGNRVRNGKLIALLFLLCGVIYMMWPHDYLSEDKMIPDAPKSAKNFKNKNEMKNDDVAFIDWQQMGGKPLAEDSSQSETILVELRRQGINPIAVAKVSQAGVAIAGSLAENATDPNLKKVGANLLSIGKKAQDVGDVTGLAIGGILTIAGGVMSIFNKTTDPTQVTLEEITSKLGAIDENIDYILKGQRVISDDLEDLEFGQVSLLK